MMNRRSFTRAVSLVALSPFIGGAIPGLPVATPLEDSLSRLAHQIRAALSVQEIDSAVARLRARFPLPHNLLNPGEHTDSVLVAVAEDFRAGRTYRVGDIRMSETEVGIVSTLS